YLEVSSPGVERTLTRDEHFARMAGSEVEVKLFSPVDGKRSVTGILKGRDGEAVTLETGDGEVRLDRAAVAKVTTVFHWN
ncbi:MAG: ribosome maturation factor RimP, partial [Clostridia bacterium]|nr:ribosome maturation factor RimP [Clostridia bacterium]